MKLPNLIASSKLTFLAPLCVGIGLSSLAFAQDAPVPAPAPNAPVPPAAVKVDPSPIAQSPGFVTSFAPIVEKVEPSVVTISTSKMMKRQSQQGNPSLNDPMLRRFFGIPDDGSGDDAAPDNAPTPRGGKGGAGRKQRQMMGLGSGVIVSPDGHILTNNHVIDGADEIIVTLGNEKKEYKAKKVGVDAGSDLAVLKIEATNLPPITFADSDKLRVGDIAIAVGNPFGLTQSVTMGIVSALGRSETHITDYENFIQTDASINPGNSGGALVDAQGRLIGINTAIYSRTGGNQGIGFAVPANQAHEVMNAILKNGKVSRGFLGIGLQDLTEDLVKAFKLDGSTGALVTEVQPKSPAEKAGVAPGDVVLEVNGKKVQGMRELQLLIGGMNPGVKVELKALREKKEMTFTVELAERPIAKNGNVQPDAAPEDAPDVLDGVTVGDLDPQLRKQYEIPATVKSGVVVTKIDPDSPSADAGIQVGDVVHEINRTLVNSAKEAVELSEKVKTEKTVLLRVSTKGTSRYVSVERKD